MEIIVTNGKQVNYIKPKWLKTKMSEAPILFLAGRHMNKMGLVTTTPKGMMCVRWSGV